MKLTTEFGQILRRLDRADTDRKRRNARTQLKAFMRRVDKAYPPLVNGVARMRKGPPPCPHCKKPSKTWVHLMVHLRQHYTKLHHGNPPRCPCGALLQNAGQAAHLRRVHREEGLTTHLGRYAFVNACKAAEGKP